MLVERTYSVKQVGELPRLTGDLNPLHQEGPMREYGRWPIVSGMQLFVDSARHAAGFLSNGGKLIRLVLQKGVAHPDEPLKVGITYHPERLVNGVRLVAFRGEEDLLSCGEAFSVIEQAEKNPLSAVGVAPMIRLPMEKGSLDDFSKLVRCEDRVAGLLYAIARSSQAMYSRILAPQTDPELALHKKMYPLGVGGTPGWLPAYTALTVFTPVDAHLDDKRDLDFKVDTAFARKDAGARIECSQAGRLLYAAESTIRLRSLDMLLGKIAKERSPPRSEETAV